MSIFFILTMLTKPLPPCLSCSSSTFTVISFSLLLSFLSVYLAISLSFCLSLPLSSSLSPYLLVWSSPDISSFFFFPLHGYFFLLLCLIPFSPPLSFSPSYTFFLSKLTLYLTHDFSLIYYLGYLCFLVIFIRSSDDLSKDSLNKGGFSLLIWFDLMWFYFIHQQ